MRARTRLALDVVLMIALVAAYRPEWTGVSLHQWLSIAIIAPLLLHVAVNWEWTIRVLRKFVERLMHVSRLNLVVDLALFLSAVTVMLSGFMVSPALFSPLGVHLPQPALWNAVHVWSANLTIAVFAIHASLHWRWAYRTATMLIGGWSKRAGAQTVSASRLSTRSLRQTATATTARRGSRVGVRAAQAKAERAAAARTLSVIGVTVVAGLTIFAGVGLASAVLPAARQSNGQIAKAGLMTCPKTGCAASTCHAQYGQSARTFYASKPTSLASQARVATTAKKKTAVRKKTSTTHTTTTAKRVASVSAATPRVATPKPAPTPARRAVVASKPRVLVCPQTGCTQTSCHGTHHQSASSFYH